MTKRRSVAPETEVPEPDEVPWEQVLEDWASIEAGDVSVEACASSRIALVKQPHASRRLSSAALHRRLAELGLAGGQPAACQRVLRCVRVLPPPCTRPAVRPIVLLHRVLQMLP